MIKSLLSSVIFLLSIYAFSQGHIQVGPAFTEYYSFGEFGYNVELSDSGRILALTHKKDFFEPAPGDEPSVYAYQLVDYEWLPLGDRIIAPLDILFSQEIEINGPGNRIAVSYTDNENKSLVYVYEFNGVDWELLGLPFEEIDDDYLFYGGGIDIAFDQSGNRLAIGAHSYENEAAASGAIFIYDYNGDEWELVGTPIYNTEPHHYFGRYVALSNDGTILATSNTNKYTDNLGFVKTFEFAGDDWTQRGQTLWASEDDDAFGVQVALRGDGNLLTFGRVKYNISNLDGVLSYLFIEDEWTNSISPVLNYYDMGYQFDLSRDGSTLLVCNKNNLLGTCYFYKRYGPNWEQYGLSRTGQEELFQLGVGVALNAVGDLGVITAGNYDQVGLVHTFIDNGVLGSADIEVEGLRIYPNPSDGSFIVSLKNDLSLDSATLYNSLGQRVDLTYEIFPDKIDFLTTVTPGIYLLKFTASGKTFTQKVVIR